MAITTPEQDKSTALEVLRERFPVYRRFREYYYGKHELLFTSRQFEAEFRRLFQKLSDNLCALVVDTMADRMSIIRFHTPDEEDEEKLLQDRDVQQVRRIWTRNRMDRRSDEVHKEGLLAGDSYVIVWPSRDDLRQASIYPQSSEWIVPEYDSETPGQFRWAAKIWCIRVRRGKSSTYVYRMNLYYPDEIRKYVTAATESAQFPDNGGAFKPFQVDGEPDSVIVNPYGIVPVFHFANNSSVGAVGVSELEVVLPLQNALNKALADMLVAMEFASLPARWATGIQIEVDEEGNEKAPFKTGQERFYHAASEAAKFGEFSAADLPQFLSVHESFRIEIARVSGTPLHYMLLANDPPSGEALKTLESRFEKKIRNRQEAFGETWEEVLQFAGRIETGRTDFPRVVPAWSDPAPVTEKSRMETLEIKKRIGVSQKQLLREMGYSETQAERIFEESLEESRSLGEAALASFDRGNV
jgi:hypothetical protein